ncbi:hypothetical protein ACFLZ2_02025 [Candidatus Margulisiibacteriota bacterium]
MKKSVIVLLFLMVLTAQGFCEDTAGDQSTAVWFNLSTSHSMGLGAEIGAYFDVKVGFIPEFTLEVANESLASTDIFFSGANTNMYMVGIVDKNNTLLPGTNWKPSFGFSYYEYDETSIFFPDVHKRRLIPYVAVSPEYRLFGLLCVMRGEAFFYGQGFSGTISSGVKWVF